MRTGWNHEQESGARENRGSEIRDKERENKNKSVGSDLRKRKRGLEPKQVRIGRKDVEGLIFKDLKKNS